MKVYETKPMGDLPDFIECNWCHGNFLISDTLDLIEMTQHADKCYLRYIEKKNDL